LGHLIFLPGGNGWADLRTVLHDGQLILCSGISASENKRRNEVT